MTPPIRHRLRFPARLGLPCGRCRAELAGLSLADACRSCREPALNSFWRHRAGSTKRPHQAAAFRLQRVWLRQVGLSVGRSRSAAEFVLDCFMLAMPGALAREIDRAPSLTGRDLSEAFAELSRKTFADLDEAQDVLTHWKIDSSESLGEVAIALIDAGLASANAELTPGDFRDIFDVREWTT